MMVDELQLLFSKLIAYNRSDWLDQEHIRDEEDQSAVRWKYLANFRISDFTLHPLDEEQPPDESISSPETLSFSELATQIKQGGQLRLHKARDINDSAALTEFMKGVHNQLLEFREELKGLCREVEGIKAEQARLKAEQDRMATVQENHAGRINQNALGITEAKAEAGEAKAEAGEAKAEAGEAKAEAGEAKTEAGECKYLKKQLKQHETCIMDLQRSNKSLVIENTNLHRKVTVLTDRVSTLEGRLLEQPGQYNPTVLGLPMPPSPDRPIKNRGAEAACEERDSLETKHEIGAMNAQP